MRGKYLLLLALTILIIVPLTHAEKLPNDDEIFDYVDNFIRVYNDLIDQYDKTSLSYNFEDYKNYFTLYKESGKSFNVICTKGNISNNDSICFIFLDENFINSPNVIIKFNNSSSDFLLDEMSISGDRISLKKVYIRVEGTSFQSRLILAVNSGKIINHTYTDSQGFSETLYYQDKEKVQELINEGQQDTINNNSQSNTTKEKNQKEPQHIWLNAIIITIFNFILLLITIIGYRIIKNKKTTLEIYAIVEGLVFTLPYGVYLTIMITPDVISSSLETTIQIIIPFIALLIIIFIDRKWKIKSKKVNKKKEKKPRKQTKNR